MRFFFIVYALVLASRWVAALYFFLLTLVTAPDDTTLLLHRGGVVMGWLQGNVALDLTLLVIGLIGLGLSFGWGNWRLGFHRYFSKKRLERLESEARRVAEDIANTLSQERQRRDFELAREFDARRSGGDFLRLSAETDQRYLAKHMLESASIIRRLEDVGYWRPKAWTYEIGVAGATSFAAESTSKEIYAAADRIKADLQDGLITLLTQPQLPQATEGRKPR